MSLPTPQSIAKAVRCDFTIDGSLPTESITNVPALVVESLQNPIDFPAWTSAIVPGDHVVLAVDPNLPQITQVISAVAQVAIQADVGQLDVVLWDEALDETLDVIRAELPEKSRVVRHRGQSRRDVRYLAADEGADPVYLNRLLVDADLVLPVVVARPQGLAAQDDLTGVFPMLADSSSRQRYQANMSAIPVNQTHSPAWLLGVQMMLAVVPNQAGDIAQILAGTTLGICSEIEHKKDVIAHADLVVAILSGDRLVQTWHNVVRGIIASMEGNEDPTIVLWTQLGHPLGYVARASPEDILPEPDEDEPNISLDEDFPAWNPNDPPTQFLQSIEANTRIFLRSEIAAELVESTGVAAMQNLEELSRLSEGFEHVRIIPAAHDRVSAVLPSPANHPH